MSAARRAEGWPKPAMYRVLVDLELPLTGKAVHAGEELSLGPRLAGLLIAEGKVEPAPPRRRAGSRS
jgi:hypothetical protein